MRDLENLRAAADHPSDPAALTAPADTGPSGAEPLIRRLLAPGLLRRAPSGTILPASTLLRTWLLEHH